MKRRLNGEEESASVSDFSLSFSPGPLSRFAKSTECIHSVITVSIRRRH